MPIVSREQTAARLARFTGAVTAHTPEQTHTVVDRLERLAQDVPERTMIHFENEVHTFRQVNERANRVAHWACSSGIGRGDVVALLMENRPEYLSTWLGLAKLGVVTSLLNTHLTGRSLGHLIRAGGNGRHLIAGSECLGKLATMDEEDRAGIAVHMLPERDAAADPVSLEPLAATDLGPVLEASSPENPDAVLRRGLTAGDDLFYIFTSGTTGLPKAARFSHMRYLGHGDGIAALARYDERDVIYCVLPLYHGAGGVVVTSCALAVGGAIALRRRFSASHFWQDVRRYRATSFHYVGEICRYLVNRPERSDDLDNGIRVVFGAGLGADIWDRFRDRFGVDRIIEGWSSTESNTGLLNVDNRSGSCGRIPFAEQHNGALIRYDIETDSHTRDENGWCITCLPGEAGEFIGNIPSGGDGSAASFEGYASEEETRRKILCDVFERGDRWYRSGDLLRRDEEDYYYFVDRIGDTYRWKGENVSTLDVEQALGECPGIELANVYGVTIPGADGRAGMAALVLDEDARFDPKGFYRFASESLPRYAVPLFLRLSQSADITSSFKLRKVELQRAGYDPATIADPLFVRDDARREFVTLDTTTLQALGIASFAAVGAE